MTTVVLGAEVLLTVVRVVIVVLGGTVGVFAEVGAAVGLIVVIAVAAGTDVATTTPTGVAVLVLGFKGPIVNSRTIAPATSKTSKIGNKIQILFVLFFDAKSFPIFKGWATGGMLYGSGGGGGGGTKLL